MEWHTTLPRVGRRTSEVIFLEASAGAARRQLLEGWLQEARSDGARTWFLSCDRFAGGPWAGLSDWLTSLVPEIQAEAPDLVTDHDYELGYLLPTIRRSLTVRNPTLTDISPDHERVRNYPMDRAFRIGHGIINLLAAWRQRSRTTARWVVVCDSFDQAGTLVRQFFSDLSRRRGEALQLTLLIVTAPGSAAFGDRLRPMAAGDHVRLDLPADPPARVDPAEMTKLARALEAQIGTDQIEMEIHLPRLLRYWEESDQPAEALRWYSWMFSLYTTRGMYEDTLLYGHRALELLERYEPDNIVRRWSIVGKIHSCYTGLGRAQEAHDLLAQLIDMTEDPALRFRGSSIMGIVYARYLPNRDLVKAEQWLERGLAEIEQSDLSELDRVFFRVFNRNGLALVRHRQGRAEEAIEMCRSGYELLNQTLRPDEHKLHRSVLLFNIAQVYAATGRYEDAIAHISMAMAMDPNYSEYYNDRGNWQMKLGMHAEAHRDYLQAIKLSPPYPEVLANLGNCCRKLGRMSEAVAAYSECLDLTPEDALARVGRGEAHEAMGLIAEAAQDYTAALALRPDLSAVRANRAILLYELGRLYEALADLDLAIEQLPAAPELHYNRATVLKALHRYPEAIQDLNAYLRLATDPSEREAVEAEMLDLSSAAGL